MEWGDCTAATQRRASEALGAGLLVLAIPVLPIILILWLVLSSTIAWVRLCFLAESDIRMALVATVIVLVVYGTSFYYFEHQCASVPVLALQTAMVFILAGIAIRLIGQKGTVPDKREVKGDGGNKT